MRRRSTLAPTPWPWPRQPNKELQNFRAGYDTSLPEAKSLRRDDGQVRPPSGMWHSTTPLVDWPTILCEPHQVAAARRPRTEASPRRLDNERGLTRRGPLQKPGWSAATSGAALRAWSLRARRGGSTNERRHESEVKIAARARFVGSQVPGFRFAQSGLRNDCETTQLSLSRIVVSCACKSHEVHP
jgi:hypothetical protein